MLMLVLLFLIVNPFIQIQGKIADLVHKQLKPIKMVFFFFADIEVQKITSMKKQAKLLALILKQGDV